MRTVGIIQARLGSTRLPGKVLADVCGAPMLHYVVGRVRRARLLDDVVVATTDRPEDAAIETWCVDNGVHVFRGDAEDVLARYFAAAAFHEADVVVRMTADCPLLDPATVDRVVARFQRGNVDYASNINPPTFPDGLDTEIFHRRALAEAHEEAQLPSEREHVTPFIRRRPERFRQANVVAEQDLSHLRWTVDEHDDLEVVRRVYRRLDDPWAPLEEVLDVFKGDAALAELNARHDRDEGYRKSVEADLLKEGRA